jgi:hypothetical protein
MSLTSILSHTDNFELRERLKLHFPTPKLNLQSDIKAIPKSKNWGIVGTAFDYLLRFFIQYHNSTIIEQRNSWVADDAYRNLMFRLKQTRKKYVEVGFYKDKEYVRKQFINLIEVQYENTKRNYVKYLNDGLITNELLENAIFLAKLDGYYRSNSIDKNFDYHLQDDVEDLKVLISIVKEDLFKANDKCYFNPTFGRASLMVGGADADLILDDTLIEIKTTKYLKLDRDYYNQLLCYYMLSIIGGINKDPNANPIKKIGVYFSRYAELWTVELESIANMNEFNDFSNWFQNYLNQKRK